MPGTKGQPGCFCPKGPESQYLPFVSAGSESRHFFNGSGRLWLPCFALQDLYLPIIATSGMLEGASHGKIKGEMALSIS